MRLIETLKVDNELGEGVIWDHVNAKVLWTDIQQKKLYRYDPNSKQLDQWDTPERLCCFATYANPISQNVSNTTLVAAFESGFAFYTPETGAIKWIKKLEQDNPGTRFNDGRTDRQGRLWAATMVEDNNKASYKGSLYCLNNDLTITNNLGNLSIPNSLCWSPSGETMYHCDTPSRKIKKYEYDGQTGSLGKAENFIQTKDGAYPDGSIVDAEGCLWNAQWGSNTVVRYSPCGQQSLVVNVPASQPSCVAFGGKGLNLLFVTSAWQGLDKNARLTEPDAGSFFIYETEYLGLIESGFLSKT